METNIEGKIIEAARATFLKKGFSGTSMSDIAAEVGLTRPAMHYYFRTKERLFQAVFGSILLEFLPKIKDYITSEMPLEEKISMIVDAYSEVFRKSPELPLFFIGEINRDIETVISIVVDSEIPAFGNTIHDAIVAEMDAGRMRKMPIMDIAYTFYGLMMAPYLTNPLGKVIFRIDTLDDQFIGKWKSNVVRQMTFLLKPEE